MDPQILSLESHDFVELEEALGDWNHKYRQISPGKFFGHFLQVQTDLLGVYRNRWESAIHYRGAPKGAMMFAITMMQTSEAHWLGQPMAVDDMCVQCGEVEADYFSAPLWDSVVFMITPAELARQIVDISHEDPDALLRTNGAVHLTPQLAAQVRQAALIYLDTALHSLRRPDAPSPLPQMGSRIVELMARALVSAQPQRCEKTSLNRSRQLIRNIEEFCRQHPDQPLRVGQLCREMDVSERTLRDAFYKLTDRGPLAYLKSQRLNRVQRALHDSDPSAAMIKQLAYDNGFYHLGNFCRDYKALFGETPSETLSRN